ncbi:glyoxalase [Rhizobium halophytocola]|uniref:Glyoxalase n=1 Tax=Rhizobium halophytocola TaxID=735519 RepID=A0ABS4DSI3_9HYPH|nr:glyoxalase [Rhizobium halophytocola]MBP1848653.1 hypothetical protein [Rhizobium halophytocola]
MNAMLPADVDMIDVMPILPSLNFEQTQKYYTESLGFTAIACCNADCLVLTRGRIELHFWRCADPYLVTNSSVFLRSDNVERLYEDFLGRGADGLVKVREDEDRLVSFHIRDPHGNLLFFGRTRVADLPA